MRRAEIVPSVCESSCLCCSGRGEDRSEWMVDGRKDSQHQEAGERRLA